MENELIITVDLGGTKILSAILNDKHEILDKVKLPTDSSKGVDNIIKDISLSINKLIGKNGYDESQIKAIAMGVPGTVNPHSGEIANAPNLYIKNFNIKEALQKDFQIPVLIENDVNLAGLGIKYKEFNNDVKNMLVVFVGTGIGGALFFDGKIYRGSSYYAGEIGHMKVSSSGKLDISKGKYTFETIASRTAVVNRITNDIKKGKKSILDKYVKADKRIKSKALKKAVKEKDKIASTHLFNSAKIIGNVLGSLTTLLNLDKIVLGGGVIEAMDEYLRPKIEDAFYSAVLPEPGKTVEIVSTKLGDDAPLYGGLALVQEFLDK